MLQYFKTNEDFTRARGASDPLSVWALIRTTICAIWIYMYRSVERMLVQIMITNVLQHTISLLLYNKTNIMRRLLSADAASHRRNYLLTDDITNYHPVRFITSFYFSILQPEQQNCSEEGSRLQVKRQSCLDFLNIIFILYKIFLFVKTVRFK